MTSHQDNWPELIAERNARGISVESFCKEMGISKSRYYAMAHLIAKRDRSQQSANAPKFVEVAANETDAKEQMWSEAVCRVLTITTSWGCIEVPL